MLLELAIILPTLNERGNLASRVKRIAAAMGASADWEVIIVDDDSHDGTADEARALALGDARVRVIQRIGNQVGGGACFIIQEAAGGHRRGADAHATGHHGFLCVGNVGSHTQCLHHSTEVLFFPTQGFFARFVTILTSAGYVYQCV